VETETPKGYPIPESFDFQTMQVPEQRHRAFAVHQRVDRVFEVDGVVFLKSTCFYPYLMERNLLFGTDEPMDTALKSITLPLPTGGYAAWPSSLFQYERLDARALQIHGSSKSRNAGADYNSFIGRE
jgi:hypothetical protein